MSEGSNLSRLLASGQFVVTGEMTTPKGADLAPLAKRADILRDYVDAVNVTDNQSAAVHLSPLACGAELVRLGLEPIVQMTCRDRNRLALQSDFLGAVALGARNILCLSGDHQRFGDELQARGVFDLDSVQLIQALSVLINKGRFIGGGELEGRVWACLGGAASPFADPLESQVRRLRKKALAGATFVQTQGIFDLDRFTQFMAEVRALGLHHQLKILAGVIPVRSLKAARYMRDHVPGIVIPDAVMARLEAAPKAREAGVALAVETIQAVRQIEGVAGVHIMAIGWDEIVPEVVRGAGLYPRPAAGG
jgi:methylenetetrahydrofolate reductase (NADPH)